LSKRVDDIERWERLVEEHPDDPRYLLKLGDLLQVERRLADAIGAYERAATLYLREGFDLRVVAIWSTILKLDPTRTALRLHLARGFAQLDMRDDAVAELRRAITEYQKKRDPLGVRLARAELARLLAPS